MITVPGHQLLGKISHCECCGLPLFLYPSKSPGLCELCFDILAFQGELEWSPCKRCGRWHTCQFECHWCGRSVCEGCAEAEHDWDDYCHAPDDT